MDPPAMMSDGRYNLAEIWQYPMSESGISRGQFGHGLAQFGDPSREVSGNDPVGLEQQQRRGGMRRRRDGEDETAKVVSTSSTSSGNAVNDGEGKRIKAAGGREQNHESRVEAEPSSGKLARREKISERMKILQDLVPGCNKVIGKALVLDEIINYIQSLQRQVEFLSMKLEAVNSGINPAIEVFPRKDVSTYPVVDNVVLFIHFRPKVILFFSNY
ncbi:hypothetical protein Gohar_004182 [Gossypium harknessii]|uniref:BHLH domain-containing protein n=1 Tax=Gossypium harknessii TaxID=34285 RepID=A0A7J9H456_9ROSI|nr:hypothetical protein [Gossypium harknessii]